MPLSIEDQIRQTNELLRDTLAGGAFAGIRDRYRSTDADGQVSATVLRMLAGTARPSDRYSLIGSRFEAASPEEQSESILQRYLLIQTALANLERLRPLPVHPSVKRLICSEFRLFL